MKKILALLLSAAMILGMSMTSMAAGTNKITVAGAQDGEVYSIYKMLDLAVNDGKDGIGNAYLYTLNDKWSDFWTSGTGKDYIDTNQVGTQTYIVWKPEKQSADDMETFGKAAAAWAKENNIDFEDSVTARGKASFYNLEDGYYMITSTYGTAVTIGSTPENETQLIMEKNTNNSVEKQVKENVERNGSGGEFGAENDAQIGDTIEFCSKITIVKNTTNLVYHDEMSSGLTFNEESVTVYTDSNCTEELNSDYYEVKTSGLGTYETFAVEFKNEYVNALTETTTVYIAYTATLNNSAETENPETNTPYISWGNNGSFLNDETKTYTRKFQILKYDGADKEKSPLAGAEFELHTSVETGSDAVKLAVNEDGTVYRVYTDTDDIPDGFAATENNKIVTLASEKITVVGVDSDDYWLEETLAPIGYNKLSERVKVQINADNDLIAEVENRSGLILPTAGGMGTTLLYTAGGILILTAAVLMVYINRKKSEK